MINALFTRIYPAALIVLLLIVGRAQADEGLNDQLQKAIALGDSTRIMELLDAGADINSGSGQRPTPLHTAVAAGKQELVEFLLSKGADINSRLPNGLTPLMMAITNRNEAIANLLIARGADVNAGVMPVRRDFSPAAGIQVAASTGHPLPPLHVAVFNYNEALVALLLRHGANPNSLSGTVGFTPLYRLAAIPIVRSNDEEIQLRLAVLLVENGASVNARNEDGKSILEAAKTAKKAAMVKFLLEKGAR